MFCQGGVSMDQEAGECHAKFLGKGKTYSVFHLGVFAYGFSTAFLEKLPLCKDRVVSRSRYKICKAHSPFENQIPTLPHHASVGGRNRAIRISVTHQDFSALAPSHSLVIPPNSSFMPPKWSGSPQRMSHQSHKASTGWTS